MEDINKIRKVINELHEKHILVVDIDIVFELDCQLNDKLTEEEYLTLYYEIRHAYMKLDNIDIGTLVYCALENKDKILKDDPDFNLREEACWYV